MSHFITLTCLAALGFMSVQAETTNNMIPIMNDNRTSQEVLTPGEQALTAAAAYAASGNQAGLRQAVIRGFECGITVNEFREILVQVYAYCGFPRALNALQTLMQTVEERGNRDTVGREPGPRPEGDARVFGTNNQTELVGRRVEGKLYDFAPAIDEYLKAHLFGDIFARDNVSWRIREMATIAMLAVRDGVESQLKSHIAIGKHNGLTDAQVDAILQIASRTKAENVLFGFGEENSAYAAYFSGASYLNQLNTEGVGIANVTFEPGCRNNWHIHRGGSQILMVVSGRGWYCEWGKPAQELKPGDVVNIRPGVKHWHGAAADSWFTHVAIAVPAENASTEWLEPVDEAEYGLLK